MHTDGSLISDERTHQLRSGLVLLLFAELLAHFDFEPASASKRLDRLHATHRRARQDTRDLVVLEQLCEPGSLVAAPSIERTQTVVTFAIAAVAGGCVADEQERHYRSASECSTARSREWVKRAEASSGDNHSTLSTSSFGSKLPERGSSSQ